MAPKHRAAQPQPDALAAHGSDGPTELREELGSALQRIERFI